MSQPIKFNILMSSSMDELIKWLDQNLLFKQDPLALDITTVLHLSQLCVPVMLYSWQTNVEYETVQFNTLDRVGNELLVNGAGELSPVFLIAVNFHRLVDEQEEAMMELDYLPIHSILLEDSLNACEEDVLHFVKKWVNHDRQSRNQFFKSLLACVRYDAKIPLQFLMDQLMCNCEDKLACNCLTAESYLSNVVLRRNGSTVSAFRDGPDGRPPRREYSRLEFLD